MSRVELEIRRKMLSRNFRARRLHQGLTIEQLADIASVDRKSVIRLEQGSPRVDWDVAFKVCGGLGVELRDLLPFVEGDQVTVDYRWSESIPPDADLAPRRHGRA